MTAQIPGIKMIPGRTLVFLDEIQKCASARTALKFLAEDGRYDVIASGSLLGLSYGRDADKEVEEVESIPVGYEVPLMMYSLDFEEFLWAYGYGNEAIDYLREFYEKKEGVPSVIHNKYEELVREFIVVGGMPEVEKKSTAKKYGDSIQWLVDANMAFSCVNLRTPTLPLRYNEKENEFKLYINDTGLLMALFGFDTKLAVGTGIYYREIRRCCTNRS